MWSETNDKVLQPESKDVASSLNIVWHQHVIEQVGREQLYGHKGALPGAVKSTLEWR